MGYTNAGKSTIHHLLTESNVLQENQLFATLDPTTRKLKLNNNDEVLMTDTVGFIRKLPHQLIDAFKATLEEVIYADLILHIIDCSTPYWNDLMTTSHTVLNQMNAPIKKEIIIFNKIDLSEFFISQLSLNSWKIGIFNIEKELIFRTHIVLLGNIRLLWKR